MRFIIMFKNDIFFFFFSDTATDELATYIQLYQQKLYVYTVYWWWIEKGKYGSLGRSVKKTV